MVLIIYIIFLKINFINKNKIAKYYIYDEVDSGINCEEPIIKAFAINEEACTFLTGVSNDFEEYIKSYLKRFKDEFLFALKEKLLRENYTQEEVKDMIRNNLEAIARNDAYMNRCNVLRAGHDIQFFKE